MYQGGLGGFKAEQIGIVYVILLDRFHTLSAPVSETKLCMDRWEGSHLYCILDYGIPQISQSLSINL